MIFYDLEISAGRGDIYDILHRLSSSKFSLRDVGINAGSIGCHRSELRAVRQFCGIISFVRDHPKKLFANVRSSTILAELGLEI